MSSREALIFDVNAGMAVAEAALRHGVSRSCANKWVARYRESGDLSALEDRSRRPEHSPERTSQDKVDALLELKERYGYGPAKLVELLKAEYGHPVMAASTAGTILARHGKVQRRSRRRAGMGPVERPPFVIGGAGDSMTTDFKGQFRMGNGALCYPLTICDPFSRYVLEIVALPSTHMAPTRAAFEHVFRRYGIPRQIISDNGTPFVSSHSLGGLTQLSRWWIELGVLPARTAPGRPDQNGIHERMHRTLKAWIARHRAHGGLRSNQRSFDAFRAEFNHQRPHQALGQRTPDTAFRPYRPFGTRPAIEYDTTFLVRKVNANGEIKWNGKPIFASEVLIGANVGLTQVGETLWSIHFGPVRIGFLDDATGRIQNRRPTPPRDTAPE